MPVETEQTTTITCDNPACPGHPDLDPSDRKGWLFISSEYYAEGTVNQHVFGSADCAGIAAQDADADFGRRPEHPLAPGPRTPPITPEPPS